MSNSALTDLLGSVQSWKRGQLRLLKQLQAWLVQQDLHTPAAIHALARAVRTLHDDRVTLAVTGEFSRGKTELLNALLFADRGMRILPADAGRSTMCPTEILWDPQLPPQLRLLPIESRQKGHSLRALRNDATQWRTFDLVPDDPQALADKLRKLTETKMVPGRQAAELGLWTESLSTHASEVEIPCWRMAQINIEQPLLAMGLRIIDTPGLNSIGSEPSLTYEILPSAHAILFLLAADTGVTRSDLEIWKRYLQRIGQSERASLMVVLNKTDTLWDASRSFRQITDDIVRQCRDAAKTLQIEAEKVFPASAQRALLARIKGDQMLERRSGIMAIERQLGEALVGRRKAMIQSEQSRLAGDAVRIAEATIGRRIAEGQEQIRGLSHLAEQSGPAIARLLQATQRDYRHYQASLEAYTRGRSAFEHHGRALRGALDAQNIERSLRGIRRSMTGAWTTQGLMSAMARLSDEIYNRMDIAGRQARSMRRLLRTMHRKFVSEHHFRLRPPPMLSMMRHQVALSLLNQEAESFRNSTRTKLTEQHFVTRQYFNTIANRARAILQQAEQEAGHWQNSALTPLSIEVTTYRRRLEGQIDDLRLARESRNTIGQKIAALQRENASLQSQLAALAKMQERLSDAGCHLSTQASGQN